MSINLRALTSFEEIAAVADFWKAHQWHPNADWDFYHVIVRTRSEIISPCVIEITENNHLLALVIGRIESTKLSIRFGYATLLAPQIRQLVLIDGGFIGEWSERNYPLLSGFLNTFLRQKRLDCALISQVKTGSPLQLTLGTHRLAKTASDIALHWLMDLPATWAEFLQSRSKKHRYWLKRLNNILDKEFPGQWGTTLYTSIEDASIFLKAAEKIADTTYHRGLGVGIRYNKENLDRMTLEAGRNQLRGYVLSIKGEPCAFWYCSTYGQTLHLCTTGYNSTLRSYELGTVLLMKVFQDHCGSAVHTVDFGLGDAGYKQRFGTRNYTEHTYMLFSPSMRSQCLSALFTLAAKAGILSKRILNKLKLTQTLKTLWRRKISQNGSTDITALGDQPTNDGA